MRLFRSAITKSPGPPAGPGWLKTRLLCGMAVLLLVLFMVPVVAAAAAPELTETKNYTAPVKGTSEAHTTRIEFLSPAGISGATKWQVMVGAGAFTPPPPNYDNTETGASDYVVNTDIPVDVDAGEDHLLLLATDDSGKIKAYKDINISGLVSQPAASLGGSGVNYSDPEPGAAIGTTKITTLTLVTGTNEWQYKVLSAGYIPASDSILAGAFDYTAGDDIPVADGQHLILLEVDGSGKIQAYDDIKINNTIIRQPAELMVLGTHYSAPVAGLKPGTTRFVTLDSTGITGPPTCWQYKVQADEFAVPPLDSILSGAFDYEANEDIPITPGKHIMLMATTDTVASSGRIKAYVVIDIGSEQINSGNMLLATPENYSIPVPGNAANNTKIETLDLSGIQGATKWQYKTQAGAFDVPAYDSTLTGANLYTAGTDILVTAGQHLVLVATDANNRIKAYADITILDEYIRPVDLTETGGGGTDYSDPIPGGAGGNTKINTLDLTQNLAGTSATKWQYAVQTGPFSVPGSETTLAGAKDYVAGTDIPIAAGQHLLLLATDNDGKIKGFKDMIVAAGQINTTQAAALLTTPANYSIPEAGSAAGNTKISSLNLAGIDGATKWRYTVQNNPFTTPALNATSATIAGINDYTAGNDIPVTQGQHLLLLATNANGTEIKAFADLTIAAGQIRADNLTAPTDYSLPVPGAAGGTTKIVTLISPLPNNASKWQYAVRADAFALPALDSTLAGAADYTADTDILIAKGQHLVLLATDVDGKIRASDDMTITPSQIRAYDLNSPANYSPPVPGAAAGTTKITTLKLAGVAEATKWRYMVQLGPLSPLLALDDVLVTASDYTAGSDISVSAGQHLILLATDDTDAIKAFVDITIKQDHIKSAATLTADKMTQTDIITGGRKITIDLTHSGFTWAADVATSQAKRNLLFDNMMPGGSEAAEWAKVAGNLKTAASPVNRVNDFVLTVTLPPTPSYKITADQTVTANVPSTLLQTAGVVTLTPATFTIKTDSMVTITGSITSSTTAADIRKGGRTIILTLLNLPGDAVWHDNVAKDNAKRQALFAALNVTAGADAPKWNTGVLDAMKASATVTRTSSSVVTISLPPVPEYNLTADQTVTLSKIPKECLSPSNNDFQTLTMPSFTIAMAGSTATIAGTIVGTSAAPASEANIVSGGSTITYTLDGDTWVYDIASNPARYGALFDVLKVTASAAGEDFQWAAVLAALKTAGSIARTSDTVVTVTLPPAPGYNITMPQTITPGIPANLLGGNTTPNVIGSFTIHPVSANVSGTAVTTATTRENIVSGGKTIILTLNNSAWAADVLTNTTKVNKLIDGIRLSAGDTDASPDSEWQKVRMALKASSGKIKVSGATLTVTLPPVPDYFILADQAVTVTIDKSLLRLPTADDLQAAPSFRIYAAALPPASATVSFDSDLSATDIISGTGKAKITITLNSDTWVGDIDTNKNNLTKLIDSFTVTTDISQWELIKNAVKTSPGTVLVKDADNIITIFLPAVSSYSIAADQVVNIKIPKTLLNLTKSDLVATPSLTIKAVVKGNLDSMLQDGSLDTLLAEHSPHNIFVNVPKKYISKVEMSNSDLGLTNLTSLSVQVEEEVNALQAITGGVSRASATFEMIKGKRVFSVAFSRLEDDTDITVTAYSDVNYISKLGNDVTVKVAPGNTVPYPPKGTSSKSLAGAYSLQKLISDSKLFSSILLQYGLDELPVTASN